MRKTMLLITDLFVNAVQIKLELKLIAWMQLCFLLRQAAKKYKGKREGEDLLEQYKNCA